MSEVELAPPSSALGKLQRGRGAGWTEAAQHPDGKDMLMTCLAADPRWDSQVESRAAYYAELCILFDVPPASIHPADAADEWTTILRFDVLAEVIRRGNQEAVPVLLDCVHPGSLDHWFISSICGLPDIDASAVAQVLLDRFDDEQLVQLALSDDFFRDQPLLAWSETSPRIADAVASANDRISQRRRPVAAPALDAPLEVILAFDWGMPLPKALVHRFMNHATPAEVDLLRRTAIGPWCPARGFALRMLGRRRDPFAIDTAARTFAANTKGMERSASHHYVRGLDASTTLPLAREWMTLDDDRSGVAYGLMAMHSQADDVPAIRAALTQEWERGYMYSICDLVEALGRHPEQGPFPELRAVFTDVGYSYARIRAARAMAATDPEFSTRFADECLWDCEPETRIVGIQASPMSSPAARARVDVLATDEGQEPAVRAAAMGRTPVTPQGGLLPLRSVARPTSRSSPHRRR